MDPPTQIKEFFDWSWNGIKDKAVDKGLEKGAEAVSGGLKAGALPMQVGRAVIGIGRAYSKHKVAVEAALQTNYYAKMFGSYNPNCDN